MTKLVGKHPSIYERVILVALSQLGKHVYGGTVPRSVIMERRTKNRVARKSRRANRG